VLPIRFALRNAKKDFESGFAAIREEFGVPAHHPPRVQREAARRAREFQPGERVDLRRLPFVAIDPPGSRDLDQAYFAEQHGNGYRVWYAIADVAGFVSAGDVVDGEARGRGVTLYAPDRNSPLHPAVLSEGAASLLPGRERPAVVWQLDLDGDGLLHEVWVQRALIRNREAISYGEAQRRIDSGASEPALVLLREIGELRLTREQARGGVSISLPSQEVERVDETYALTYDTVLPAERWNAQISLLTGIAAARLMLDAGVGVLRTLPPPDPEVLESLRRRAGALRLRWPTDQSYPDFVRGLDPDVAENAAMLTQSMRALRGAGYEAFDGSPPAVIGHAGVASSYAHVTAPLRRLVDRYGLEVAMAAHEGRRPPGWALSALEDLPEIMGAARRRERGFERAIVDLVETVVLGCRVGEEFPAVVVDRHKDTTTVMLREPAIIARAADGRAAGLGDEVVVRVAGADPAKRQVELELV